MKLPNFIIAGAAKSGTTALAGMLAQHPDVFMSPLKEPSYFLFADAPPSFCGPGDEGFNRQVVTSWREYTRLFEAAAGRGAVGEASVFYLYNPACFPRIRKALGDVRIILVLRDPVERAFSAYAHMRRDGREVTNFEAALRDEDRRVSAGWEYVWHYRRVGEYGSQCRALFDVFPPEAVRVYRYSDLEEDPRGVCRDAFAFLDVDAAFVPDVGWRPNVSGEPRSRLLYRLMVDARVVHPASRMVLPRRTRKRLFEWAFNRNLHPSERPHVAIQRELRAYFEPEVRLTQRLTGADLSRWLPQAANMPSGREA